MNKLKAGHSKQPILGVKRKLWRQDDEHSFLKEEKYKEIRNSILSRDDNTCQFCGFKFDEFQEVHHIDDDHGNSNPDNLITSCNLCHAVHHLGMTAIRNAGFIAYIPEMKQTDINGIFRILFMQLHVLGKNEKKDIVKELQSFYSIFENRGAQTLGRLTKSDKVNLSNPMILAQFLSACDDELYQRRCSLLSGFVLIPTRNAFTDSQLDSYYTKYGSNSHSIDSYKKMFKQLDSAKRGLM